MHRLSVLEEKATKESGRKRQTLHFNGQELTDDDIVYYVDNEFMTISELEKDIGANKNQIRNRYKRRKKQLAIRKNILKNPIYFLIAEHTFDIIYIGATNTVGG